MSEFQHGMERVGRRGIEAAAQREADLERWLVSFDGYEVASDSPGDFYYTPLFPMTWQPMAVAIEELLVEHPEAVLTMPEQM